MNTGLGFDKLQPSMLRSLPQEGDLQLLLLLRRMEADMTLPFQLMLNLIALLDEPDSSVRLDAWDASQAGPWDAAVRGSGALEAAYDSELSMEMDHLGGKTTAGGLLDIAKFYNNIDLCILVDEAIEKHYPLPCLVLAIEAYVSPKCIRKAGMLHAGLLVWGSIIAGCSQATSYARLYLWNSRTCFA